MKASDRDLEIARGDYDDSAAVERIIEELMALRAVADAATAMRDHPSGQGISPRLADALRKVGR